jgi:Mrp family chromosome partitioning ATPase/capsular polysaccharide biosynthesis protein
MDRQNNFTSVENAADPDSAHGFSWSDPLKLFKRHMVLSLAAALSISAFYIYHKLHAEPMYKSVAIAIYEPAESKQNVLSGVGSNRNFIPTPFILRNYLTELRSNNFREKVIASLSAEERSLIIASTRQKEQNDLHSIIASANHINLAAGNILQFEFHHPRPDAAALLANRFCTEFQAFLLERSRLGNAAAIRFLKAQSEDLKLRIEQSELEIQRYRQDRHMVSLEESQNLVVERMKDLSKALHAARLEELNAQSETALIPTANADTALLEKIPSITSVAPLPELIARRESLHSKLNVLGQRYGTKHPRMLELQGELVALQQEVSEAMVKVAGDLLSKQELLATKVQKLKRELQQAETTALNLDVVSIEYNVLRRKLETDKRLFTQIHQQLNEANIASQLTYAEIKTVDRAWAASEPFSPDPVRIYAVGAGLFFLSFFAVPFVVRTFDTRLRGVEDIESHLKYPFLGEVRKFPPNLQDPHRLVFNGYEGPERESFRQLQSHLLLKLPSGPSACIVIITSALPEEGKTFMAINLAASFARHGCKTLLMDCDFRKPSILQALGLASKATGDDWQVFASENPYLDIQAQPTQIDGPTEYIESKAFRERLQNARSNYKIIILDAPPSALFPDAALMGRQADFFVFVTILGRHRWPSLAGILRRLNSSPAQVIGIIANKVPSHLRPRHNAYNGYQYGNYKKYRQYDSKA